MYLVIKLAIHDSTPGKLFCTALSTEFCNRYYSKDQQTLTSNCYPQSRLQYLGTGIGQPEHKRCSDPFRKFNHQLVDHERIRSVYDSPTRASVPQVPFSHLTRRHPVHKKPAPIIAIGIHTITDLSPAELLWAYWPLVLDSAESLRIYRLPDMSRHVLGWPLLP